MTAQELIALLSKLPPDTEVFATGSAYKTKQPTGTYPVHGVSEIDEFYIDIKDEEICRSGVVLQANRIAFQKAEGSKVYAAFAAKYPLDTESDSEPHGPWAE